jgi:saccharopine dehydrogenase-like NADP-dependent oxidoreductase
LKTVCFRAGFPKEFFDKMKFLVDLGFASEKPIDIKDCKLSPRDFLAKFVNRLPKPKERLNEIEDLKVELYGYKGKRKLKIYEDCITKSQKKWFEFGSDIDTGMPLSIIAQIIAKGLIKEKGVYSPEQVFVDKKLQNIFFRELKKRGMKFREKIQSGWN